MSLVWKQDEGYVWEYVLWLFAILSNLDLTMVNIHSRRLIIHINHYKIIQNFPRLLKGVEKSRIGKEKEICTIYKFLQSWHSITIYFNLCYIVKNFYIVRKNYIWRYTLTRDHMKALRTISGCQYNRSTVRHLYIFTVYLSLSSLSVFF